MPSSHLIPLSVWSSVIRSICCIARDGDYIFLNLNQVIKFLVNSLQLKFPCDMLFQVPIQVNKYLAYSDGMRVIESGKLSAQSPASDGLLFAELDR